MRQTGKPGFMVGDASVSSVRAGYRVSEDFETTCWKRKHLDECVENTNNYGGEGENFIVLMDQVCQAKGGSSSRWLVDCRRRFHLVGAS